MPATEQQKREIALAFIRQVHGVERRVAIVHMDELMEAAGQLYDGVEGSTGTINGWLDGGFKQKASVAHKARLFEYAVRALSNSLRGG